MKRQIVYPGAVPLETDILNTNKNVMIAIAGVLQDMLGTATLFSGLACVPTAPAGMTVNVNPGCAYSLQQTDTGAYSSLPADAHQILKQGLTQDATNFACPAPVTAGFSINYLVQAAFQEVDGGNVVLPYYNATNPAQAYNGPGGNGQSQATARDNTVQLQLKAGAAATTGTQVTPTPDAGFTGLWVVTVAFGATTITSGNITQYPSAPLLPASLLQMIRQAGGIYAGVATGTANAHVIAPTPPITARVDGMVVRYKASSANTGALTLNDGLGAATVVGGAHAALQGGETAANGDVWVQWNTSIGGGSYVLPESTGGALQVSPATQSQHAVQLGQVTSTASPLAIATQAAANANQALNLGQFISSASSNGYIKIPTIIAGVQQDIIIQWGKIEVIAANNFLILTYPIAFPNGLFSIAAIAGALSIGAPSICGVNSNGNGSNPKAGFSAFNSSATTATQPGSYIAIGW